MLKIDKGKWNDNITAEMLQNVEAHAFEILTELYNKI